MSTKIKINSMESLALILPVDPKQVIEINTYRMRIHKNVSYMGALTEAVEYWEPRYSKEDIENAITLCPTTIIKEDKL